MIDEDGGYDGKNDPELPKTEKHGNLKKFDPWTINSLKDDEKTARSYWSLGDSPGLWKAFAAYSNAANFKNHPNKKWAWGLIHKLTEDQDVEARSAAAYSVGLIFNHVDDKMLAWRDLHKLSLDKNGDVRAKTAEAIGYAFEYVPELLKIEAWDDYYRLVQDMDKNIRRSGALSLGRILKSISLNYGHQKSREQMYYYMEVQEPITFKIKRESWEIIYKLSKDESDSIRRIIARTYGDVIKYVPYVPSRNKIIKDLMRLSKDKDNYVRSFANHSLGRAFVLIAAEAKTRDEMEKKLRLAISYFQESSEEKTEFKPAEFCLPFYRSYFAVAFENADETEVNRYLEQAKRTVEGSKSKEELLEAVENLAKAVNEAQKLENRSIKEISSELRAYRWYCEKAEKFMDSVEDSAPETIRLMKRCRPILKEEIEVTIPKIQDRAEKVLGATQSFNEKCRVVGIEINEAAKSLTVSDLAKTERCCSRIVVNIKNLSYCQQISENEQKFIDNNLNEVWDINEFPEKLEKIVQVLDYMIHAFHRIADIVILTILPEEYAAIRKRLSNLRSPPLFGARPNLYAWAFGDVYCHKYSSNYTIAVGMIGRAGTIQSALATIDAIMQWKPRYVFFVGIAGGLQGLEKGDVIIADTIYGYEYGKIEKAFLPRKNWTYSTDLGLLNLAIAYSIQGMWLDGIKETPPIKCIPKAIKGEIASGDKVVDDPENSFFAVVLDTWEKIKAIEMEGVGAANAIEQAHILGHSVGFMMIRGISDLPRKRSRNKRQSERDVWKRYASDTAAAFTAGWIEEGLPMKPSFKVNDDNNI